jgi:hypothetical protein
VHGVLGIGRGGGWVVADRHVGTRGYKASKELLQKKARLAGIGVLGPLRAVHRSGSGIPANWSNVGSSACSFKGQKVSSHH